MYIRESQVSTPVERVLHSKKRQRQREDQREIILDAYGERSDERHQIKIEYWIEVYLGKAVKTNTQKINENVSYTVKNKHRRYTEGRDTKSYKYGTKLMLSFRPCGLTVFKV